MQLPALKIADDSLTLIESQRHFRKQYEKALRQYQIIGRSYIDSTGFERRVRDIEVGRWTLNPLNVFPSERYRRVTYHFDDIGFISIDDLKERLSLLVKANRKHYCRNYPASLELKRMDQATSFSELFSGIIGFTIYWHPDNH